MVLALSTQTAAGQNNGNGKNKDQDVRAVGNIALSDEFVQRVIDAASGDLGAESQNGLGHFIFSDEAIGDLTLRNIGSGGTGSISVGELSKLTGVNAGSIIRARLEELLGRTFSGWAYGHSKG